MVAIIGVTDLPADLQSAEMIDLLVAGANARAARVAPCLVSTDPAPSDGQLAEAKLTLVGAVKRWAEAGAGAVTQQTVGPYSQSIDTRSRTGFNLWPSEIEALQEICRDASASTGAFSIRPHGAGGLHAPFCDLMFGGATCSCGANLTNYEFPLYEG